MGVNLSATYLQWSQPVNSQSSSSAQTIASAILSPWSKIQRGGDRVIACQTVRKSPFLGTSSSSTKLLRSRSCDNVKSRGQFLRRACSANFDGYPDEEFAEIIRQLAHLLSRDGDEEESNTDEREDVVSDISAIDSREEQRDSKSNIDNCSSINSVRMPSSFQPSKLESVQASFVWLFQQVFSCTLTPTVYVMILLANFTVYSMGKKITIAGPPPPPPPPLPPPPSSPASGATEIVSVNENQPRPSSSFDSCSVKTKFSVSSPMIGKTTFVGGHNGGGREKLHRVMSGGAGDGPSDSSSLPRKYRPLSYETSSENPFEEAEAAELEESFVETDPSKAAEVTNEEERKLWLSLEDEAIKMQSEIRGEALGDNDTVMDFVTPISVDIEPEYESDYLRTELLYKTAVSEQPNNPMILANYAHFLHVVLHDHDRAEEYFKRAIAAGRKEGGGGGGGDAEALIKYATFLWVARKDIEAAAERYVEAIEAEPGNTYHAASYAYFLWNTGGEDAGYPLDSLNDNAP